MKRNTLILTLVTAALTLSACGDTQAEQSSPEIGPREQDGPMTDDPMAEDPTADIEYALDQEYFFFGQDPSTIGKFRFPSGPVPEIEELRESVDAPEVTYVTMTIDNRHASESQSIQGLDAFDEAGRKYEFQPADHLLSEWRNMLEQDEDGLTEDVEHYNAFVEVSNEHLHGPDAGELSEFTVIYDGTDLPDDLTRIAVYTSGLINEPVVALPIDHPEAQYVDLDFEAPAN
jgi:hypothetical protein